ncbi:hypothetical protein GLYMA_03G115066v4 [Glycine max]|nr:hypothetical protein GLYMA_03G115066v4 [Glycine max]KAH1069536.1 hypothetical protein GYH30_006934 [Glycine max]
MLPCTLAFSLVLVFRGELGLLRCTEEYRHPPSPFGDS